MIAGLRLEYVNGCQKEAIIILSKKVLCSIQAASIMRAAVSSSKVRPLL